MWTCITEFFTYETTKSVVVKSWTIGIINRVVQLLIITYFIGWVFVYEKAYQIRDTAIESSVMTKVKGFGLYNNRVMDVAEYVTPSQGASVFCIITKLITTENQVQGYCPESEMKYKCTHDNNCTKFLNKPGGNGLPTGRCVRFNDTLNTCEIRGWCPAEIDYIKTHPMMEVENFTIFIKNSIRFPLFNFTKGNFLPTITPQYIKACNFDHENNTYCPIFRVGDVIRYAHQNFTTLAQKGGVIGIKIGWMCDLDKSEDECNPSYSFTRLDAMSEKNSVSPGYNFRYAEYYKMDNGTDYRTLLNAVCILFFSPLFSSTLFSPLLISSIPFYSTTLFSFSALDWSQGTVLCDIILLNFLKGAEQYKARKFEEVSDTQIEDSLSSNGLYRSREFIGVEKQSNDSGAFSIGQYG
uniref:P2X purinoceptor n=1 Tax=Hucho hucho TaxID=62062 RepID=A0A4W5NS94_9TELE